MKIKVAILDQDQNYQNRLMVALRETYAEVFDVYPCNGLDALKVCVENNQIDLVVISENMDISSLELEGKCGITYFTEFKQDGNAEDKNCICKYQELNDLCKSFIKVATAFYLGSVDLVKEKTIARIEEEEKNKREDIIRQEQEKIDEEVNSAKKELNDIKIRVNEKRVIKENLIKEKKEREEEQRRQEEEKKKKEEEQRLAKEKLEKRRANPKIVMFMSVFEGDGSTSASMAYALNAVKKGLNVLYVNFKTFSNMNNEFSIEPGKKNFSQIVEMANNDTLEKEDISKAIVKNDKGIYYISQKFSPCLNAELDAKGAAKFVEKIKETLFFDRVVIGLDTGVSSTILSFMDMAAMTIFVGNGSVESNKRILLYVDSLKERDGIIGTKTASRVAVLYNKFERKSKKLNGVKDLGVLNLNGSFLSKANHVLEDMTKLEAFDKMNSVE